MIDEIMYYAEAETSLTLGVNLFKNYFPEKDRNGNIVSDTAALIRPIGGPVDFYLTDQGDFMIALYTRSHSLNAIDILNAEFKAAFHARADQPLPVITSGAEYIIMTSQLMTWPIYSGIDEKKRHVYTFDAVLRNKEKN